MDIAKFIINIIITILVEIKRNRYNLYKIDFNERENANDFQYSIGKLLAWFQFSEPIKKLHTKLILQIDSRIHVELNYKAVCISHSFIICDSHSCSNTSQIMRKQDTFPFSISHVQSGCRTRAKLPAHHELAEKKTNLFDETQFPRRQYSQRHSGFFALHLPSA